LESAPRNDPGKFYLADPVTGTPSRAYLLDGAAAAEGGGVPGAADSIGVVTKTASGRQRHDWTRGGVELWSDAGKGYGSVVERAWFEVEVWDGKAWAVAKSVEEKVALSQKEEKLESGGVVHLRAEGLLEGLEESFTATGEVGFDGRQYRHKFSFGLPASKDGQKRRVVWKVRVSKAYGEKLPETEGDYCLEVSRPGEKGVETAKVRPVRLRVGDMELGWAEAVKRPEGEEASKEPNSWLPRVGVDREARTVSVWFGEEGTAEAVEIDPTLSIETSSSTITVDDGTRKWVWKDEAGKPTVAEFYHDNVGGGTDNCACTYYYMPGFGVLPYYSAWYLSSSDVFSLEASSGAVARVHRKCSGMWDVETRQAVWASGRCYSRCDWTSPGGAVTGMVLQHYNTVDPQVMSANGDGSAVVISDTTNNNYPGLSSARFASGDYPQLWGPYTWPYADMVYSMGGMDGIHGHVLVSCADYRATATTRDAEKNDYCNPDPLNDGANAGKVLVGTKYGDGFDEAWGCYDVTASGDQVEARFDDKRGGATSYTFKGLRLKIRGASTGKTWTVQKKSGDGGTYATLASGTDYNLSELGGGEYAFEYFGDVSGTGSGGRTYFRFSCGPELRITAAWTTKLTDADFSLAVTESDSSFVSAQRGTSVDSGGVYQANADAADVVQDGVVNDTDVVAVAGDIGKSSAGETNVVAKSSDGTPPKIEVPRWGRVKLTFEREGTTKPVHISYGGLDIYSYGGKCPPTYSDADTLTAYTRSQAQRSKFTVRAATFVDEGQGWVDGNLECLVELKVSCIGVDITEFPEAVSLYDTIEVRADARASGEGTLAWTIMGEGGGTFGDPSSPTTTFSPTTLGSATVVVNYNNPPALTADTHQVTIVAFDADITSAPVVMGLGDSETVTATVNPAGGTLAWSLEGDGGGTFSPADALESRLTATTPGSAMIVLSYTSGGYTITEKRPLAILDVKLVGFPRYVAHAALLQSEPTPEGVGNLEWSILGGTGGGTLYATTTATALFEAATAGSVQVQVRYSAAHVSRTDSDTFTVLTCRITNKPAIPAVTRVGDTFPVTAEGAPAGEGTLEWSVIFGPGDGEFEDAGAPSTTFTATKAGAATLEAAYGTAGVTAVDRVGLTILGLRLVAVPEVVSLSDAVTMVSDPQPAGAAALAWSISGDGDGTFSDTTTASTLFTPTKVGAATVKVTYGTAGVTCEATSPVVIVGHDVDIETGPPAVMVAGETCQVTASISPEGGTFSWSVVGDAQGTFENASSLSTVFTATGAGRAVVRASYTKDEQTVTDERALTIIAVDIVQGAEALAWGETMTVACDPQPRDAGGTLAWSLMAGSGNGELEPTTGLWSDLTPTAAGTMSLQVGYTTGGKTAFDTLVVRVLRAEITSMPSVIAVGGQAQVTANVSPPAGADGTALLWSLLYDGDALVEFDPANAATATMTGTAGGTTTVMVWQYYETAGVYVTDQRELTVLGVDITEAPSQVSVGDTAAFTAAPVPPGVALLAWSIAGDGGGTFSDTATVSTVFTPTTPGAAVVTVTYSTGGVTASDTCAVTILGLDVDLSSWPAYMVRGETATVSAWVDGNGDLLEWSLIGGSGSGSFDPAQQANLTTGGTKSTTLTATAGGVVEFQAGYSAPSNRSLVATDAACITVLSADITMLPATVSVGDTVNVRARALPESVGTLTWSLEGTGTGSFTDAHAAVTKLLPTQPGTAVVSVQYTLGGKTASASKTITILPFDVDITTYPVFIATTKSDTLQATTDPPGNEGILAWSLMPSTGGGQLNTTQGGTVILTGETPGLIAIAVEWTSGTQTARDEVGIAVVDMHIETKPAGAGVGHPITIEAHALPVPVGLFEWSILGGPGGGTISDTASASIEFTPTTAGSVTLGVTYKVGSVVLTDTCQFPIVLQDVDITTAPAALVVGGQATVAASASPSGGTLAWSVMPDWSGDGTFSDTTQASTTFTATQAGGARLVISYTSGGITVTDERYLPILSVEMDTPAAAVLSVGDTLPLTCWETPWGEAVLAWSVTGDGGGSFSPSNESSTVFTPTTPGAAVLTVTYSTGGATAMDTYPVTILACDVDITVSPPSLMVKDETATVQAAGTPAGGTLAWAMMPDADNTGNGSFSDPASATPVFTATTPGYARMRVAYSKDGATAYDTAVFTILGIKADPVPPVLSLGDTLPVSAAETPWLGGSLEWSVLSGPGNGSFADASAASTVFTPSTTGQVTLQIADTYEGKTAKDTLTFTIVGCDVDILQAPSQIVSGTTAPLTCSVSPEGGSLAWTIIPSGGSATIDDPDNTSTFMTAGDTGLVYIQAAYTQGGEVAYETRPCLIIDNVIPDAPTGAFVTAGWGNDTNVVNCSNVDYAVVEVALPASTKSYDTIEVTLTDQYDTHAIGTAPGGETTVYVIVDCTALHDGELALSVRAYNAAGSSSTLTGIPAVKDATPPTITLNSPENGSCVELPYVMVAGSCPDSDIKSFTINGAETPLTNGTFQQCVTTSQGSWGTTVYVSAEDEHRNVTTVSSSVEVVPLEIRITTPEDEEVVGDTATDVSGTLSGPQGVSVFVNGTPASGGLGSFSASGVPLSEGWNAVTARAMAAYDYIEDAVWVFCDTTDPVVTIVLPWEGDYIADDTVDVEGYVEDDTLASVKVNGVEAELYGGYFIAYGVPLEEEGENTLTVVATDAGGNEGEASVTVVRDTEEPEITEITVPEDETQYDEEHVSTWHSHWVRVEGRVTSEEPNLQAVYVRPGEATEEEEALFALGVREVEATVYTDNTFKSPSIPLEKEYDLDDPEGTTNIVTVVAVDKAGNTYQIALHVKRNLPPIVDILYVWLSSADPLTNSYKVTLAGTIDDKYATTEAVNHTTGATAYGGAGGWFTIEVDAQGGGNWIEVIATDLDGQEGKDDVAIYIHPGDTATGGGGTSVQGPATASATPAAPQQGSGGGGPQGQPPTPAGGAGPAAETPLPPGQAPPGGVPATGGPANPPAEEGVPPAEAGAAPPSQTETPSPPRPLPPAQSPDRIPGAYAQPGQTQASSEPSTEEEGASEGDEMLPGVGLDGALGGCPWEAGGAPSGGGAGEGGGGAAAYGGGTFTTFAQLAEQEDGGESWLEVLGNQHEVVCPVASDLRFWTTYRLPCGWEGPLLAVLYDVTVMPQESKNESTPEPYPSCGPLCVYNNSDEIKSPVVITTAKAAHWDVDATWAYQTRVGQGRSPATGRDDVSPAPVYAELLFKDPQGNERWIRSNNMNVLADEILYVRIELTDFNGNKVVATHHTEDDSEMPKDMPVVFAQAHPEGRPTSVTLQAKTRFGTTSDLEKDVSWWLKFPGEKPQIKHYPKQNPLTVELPAGVTYIVAYLEAQANLLDGHKAKPGGPGPRPDDMPSRKEEGYWPELKGRQNPDDPGSVDQASLPTALPDQNPEPFEDVQIWGQKALESAVPWGRMWKLCLVNLDLDTDANNNGVVGEPWEDDEETGSLCVPVNANHDAGKRFTNANKLYHPNVKEGEDEHAFVPDYRVEERIDNEEDLRPSGLKLRMLSDPKLPGKIRIVIEPPEAQAAVCLWRTGRKGLKAGADKRPRERDWFRAGDEWDLEDADDRKDIEALAIHRKEDEKRYDFASADKAVFDLKGIWIEALGKRDDEKNITIVAEAVTIKLVHVPDPKNKPKHVTDQDEVRVHPVLIGIASPRGSEDDTDDPDAYRTPKSFLEERPNAKGPGNAPPFRYDWQAVPQQTRAWRPQARDIEFKAVCHPADRLTDVQPVTWTLDPSGNPSGSLSKPGELVTDYAPPQSIDEPWSKPVKAIFSAKVGGWLYRDYRKIVIYQDHLERDAENFRPKNVKTYHDLKGAAGVDVLRGSCPIDVKPRTSNGTALTCFPSLVHAFQGGAAEGGTGDAAEWPKLNRFEPVLVPGTREEVWTMGAFEGHHLGRGWILQVGRQQEGGMFFGDHWATVLVPGVNPLTYSAAAAIKRGKRGGEALFRYEKVSDYHAAKGTEEKEQRVKIWRPPKGL